LNFDVYLLNATGSNIGNLVINTLDEFSRTLSNSVVKLLEYNDDDLRFIQVSECRTNSNGECIFGVELNRKTYIATATKSINSVIYYGQSSQEGELLLEDPSIRDISLKLLDPFTTQVYNNLVITIEETFLNDVSNIDVDFFTKDGLNTEVCVKYYQTDIGNEQLVYEECVDTSASIQTITTNVALNRSNTYRADITQSYGSQLYLIDSYVYNSDSSLEFNLDANNYIEPFLIFLFVAVLSFSLYTKNISMFFFVSTILIWWNVRTFPSINIVSGAVLYTVIAVFNIYTARKKQELN